VYKKNPNLNKEKKYFFEEMPIVNWFVDKIPKESRHIKVDSGFLLFLSTTMLL